MGKELKIGGRYMWKDVKAAYPGKWVRMSDCELDEFGDIIEGVLVGVYTDEEHGDALAVKYKEHSKDLLRRTAFGMNIGIINCLNVRMEVDTDEC